MIRLAPALLLILNLSSIQAKDDYVTGFEVVPVADFKKAWEASGNTPLKFPPRSENAVIVSTILEHSSADWAGLKELDIIRVVNGKFIEDPKEFKTLLGEITEKHIKLSVTRRGKKRWQGKSITVRPRKESEFYKSAITTNKGDATMRHHTRSHMATNAANGFYAYYTIAGGRPELYLRMTYTANDWLFINKYEIITDSKTYTINPTRVSRKAGGIMRQPKVWEWYDHLIKESEHKMLEDIASSGSVTIRYVGSNASVSRKIVKPDRSRAGVVLDAFKFKFK